MTANAETRRALATYVALMRAADAVTRRAHAHLASAGLTLSQFGVLEAIAQLGPLGQRELGRKVLRSPNNMTTVIDNLEKRGLVERHADERDRRIKRVHLTDEGRALIEALFPRHAAGLTKELAALSPTEQDQLRALARRLVEAPSTSETKR